MKINRKAQDHRIDQSARLAGGYGLFAATQDAEALLRRSVMANLLWEDLFYEDGVSVVDNIAALIPQVAPETVTVIAVEARTRQKLRHVPLLIAREMARIPTHRQYVGSLLPQIILRADELAEFLAIYWKEGKCPLSKQVKTGLARAFDRFDAYQLAKYNRDYAVKLRDVMFMVHPKPAQGKEELYKQVAEDTLPTPDTWEVALSAGANKRDTWTRLIREKKLGALAFVRNLRNMEEADVPEPVIVEGFNSIDPRWLLPLNYFAAAKASPRWTRELEGLMLRGFDQAAKLPGRTVFVVDVSGSMDKPVSERSHFNRLEVAAAMTVMAYAMCEHVELWATAGNDDARVHATKPIKPIRGFALAERVRNARNDLGRGGIFTRQCLEYIQSRTAEPVDRIIVFSDSQDCDVPGSGLPKPFGVRNYVVDVSAHQHGVNYKGLWTAEVSGWSEHFLTYILALEGSALPQQDDEQA
jgi:60 kDa SS-A/Ro ribonucleoprotein